MTTTNNRYAAPKSPIPTPQAKPAARVAAKTSPALTIAKQKALAKAIDAILYEVY
jgi:hypothetical protein